MHSGQLARHGAPPNYLGGKDNVAVDRAAAEAVVGVAPEIREAAVQGRALIKRVVERLVRDAGITQIIDLGSGLPTRENVHQIAHAINPAVRVAYVDHDAVVCAHGRAVPRSQPEIARFFGPFTLEPPGLVNIWPFETLPPGVDADLATTGFSGLARKPD